MKKILSLLFLFSFFTMTLACNFENPEIEFTDSSFEEAIREIVNKEEGSIYASDVRNITVLNLFGKNITSL
jgi:hypothetical protein